MKQENLNPIRTAGMKEMVQRQFKKFFPNLRAVGNIRENRNFYFADVLYSNRSESNVSIPKV